MIRKSDFKCLAGIIAGIFTMASAVCAADEATLGGQTLQPVMVGDDDGMYLRYQIDGSGKADIADGADPLGDEAGRSGVLEYKDSSGTVFLPAGASFSPQNADAVRHTIWEPANAN